MATGMVVFAAKSVATSAISFWVNKAFTCLDKYCKAEGLEDVKKRLEQSLPKIQVVLSIANPECIKEQGSALDAWLWQLRDAVEEAEDAVDDLEYYELKEKAKGQKVSDWGSSFAKMKHTVVKSVKHVSILDKNFKQFTQRGTLKRLRKAIEGLDKAATDIANILAVTGHLKGVVSGNQRQEHWMNKDRETGSTSTATKFVGREKETAKILRWLTKTSVETSEIVMSADHVPILSVVGHGGMGKTALAQRICEQEIVKHLKLKVIWICVSTSFDATSVTSKILESATGTKPNANHLEALQQDLKRRLELSTNFLLVLDDVWEDKKRDEWEKLFAPLRTGKSGSKILLTTRMQSVADMAAKAMGTETECLTVGGLEEGENLELFNHHVFSGLNSQDFVDLKLTGEQIATKLGGCPLVTKVVGGHLQCNMTSKYWNTLLHEGLEHFKGTEEDIMEVLKLSYYHLPTELQICFRYCSIFSQDYKFTKKDLVLMWMGSGLISQAGNESRRLEDIGEQILAQLTRKSFFDMKFKVYQYSQRKEEYYVMHDLMHELARYVSSGECARIIDPSMLETEKDTIRHLCIPCVDHLVVEDVKKISHFKNVRTIIFEGKHLVNKHMVRTIENVVENSKALRLLQLNLENTFHLRKLADLKHLRYIYLPKISPEGMCGLVKLYHLMVVNCFNCWQKEPRQVRYLGNIDHLRYVSSGLYRFGEFPIGRLTSLQELQSYRVQGKEGNRISAIRNLRELRELQVQGLENVENPEEADNAKLNEKEYLSSLSLEWSARPSVESSTDELLIDHCKPHENIRDLTISGYGGIRAPIWIEKLSVKRLISLKLVRCINWEHLPSLGEFASLKHLTLENLHRIQRIGQSSHVSSSCCTDPSLPASLDTLIVRCCPELIELPVLPPSMVYLKISDAGLTKLPRIGKPCSEDVGTKPSQLLHIRVNFCPRLTSLDGSVLVQKQYIRTICVLHITKCEELEYVPLTFEGMDALTELDIRNCPKLKTTRETRDKLLPLSLEKLTIMQCGDLELPLLASLHGLTNLSELVMQNCSGLLSLPSANVFKSLKSLQFMEIIGCENLSSLAGLGSLQSLFELKIISCRKITEVGSFSLTPYASSGSGDGGEEHMVMPTSPLQIDYLEIDLPSVLLFEPLEGLCHTRGLMIRDGMQMESLPERWLLQNRKELRSLKILCASSLESLPLCMRELCSLNFLLLSGAGKLKSLPELPSSLQCLHVMGCCPELEKQIRVKDSPEWNNISHIAKVHIDPKIASLQTKYSDGLSINKLPNSFSPKCPLFPLPDPRFDLDSSFPPARIPNSTPDPVLPRRDLSIGTNFTPYRCFFVFPRLGFPGAEIGSRSARFRRNLSRKRPGFVVPLLSRPPYLLLSNGTIMLHQENSEVFVRHHSEQLACGNLRGTDDGRSNFRPENYHIATEWNATACLFNTASAVKEVTVDHNKRPASNGLLDMVDCKRMKQEDQTLSEKDHHVADADVNVPDYKSYMTCERTFDPPAYGNEESEDEGVDSPVHYSLAHTYVEDYLRSASFHHQREDIFSSVSLCPTRKTVPIGPKFQVELPECASGKERSSVDDYGDLSSPSHICDGSADESDKWIRNCVIPMPSSIELSSTLKPVCCKADCTCVDEDSIECVRKHVREARERLNGALGPNTFKELGLCEMGEEVALRWTEDEEHLFQEVVSSNPATLGRNFWDELPLAFPSKTSMELVSYYFNVFMLRKRAEQNRFDPTNVDSDDDEWQGSVDDEFTITDRADEDLPLESLTDQDDGACNQVSLEGNIHEESSGDRQENCCAEGDVMVSGHPVMSSVDHNQEAIRSDTDAQDDSCTSFEAQQVGVADGTPTDITGDHYGFGSVADHGYFGGHCDSKAWDIGLTSMWEKDEFLSTNNVIQEVFGKGSCENGNDSSAAQGII